MKQTLGIDWYSVHKFDNERFNIQQFNRLVGEGEIGYGIQKVSGQYRKKLLMMFQKASKIMKERTPDIEVEVNQLGMRKALMGQQILRREQQLESSFLEINNLKMIAAERKRVLVKLKQKIAKKHKNKQKRVYCCSYCDRSDFQSIQALKSHLLSNHPGTNLENRSEASNQVNQIKDLLMTMKDKEIQMMSMFLRASKEMQTQKIEKQYQTEYNRFMQISNTKTDESKEQQQTPQLKGESKFLFFQKSQDIQREIERDTQIRNNFRRNKEQYQQKLNKQFYNSKDYYGIFKNVQQNVSGNIQDNRRVNFKTEQEQQQKNSMYYDPNEFLSRFLKNHNISKESRFSLVQNTPKPMLQFKQGKQSERQIMFAAPSISDRLRQLNKKNDPKYQTLFSTKRKFYEDSGYVFNSGPLVEDEGGDSDAQDYFGQGAVSNSEIEDEQIKIHPQNKSYFNRSYLNNKSYAKSGKESFHLSKLLSPKDSNSEIEKSQKEKSSVIVDLSDSFSRRDFQISKDEETINLSDLKLSKLQKKKQQERLKKLKDLQQKKSVVSDSIQNRTNSKDQQSGSDHSKVSRQTNKQILKYDLLKQFEKKKQIVPLIEDKIQEQLPRKNQRINIIGLGENSMYNRFQDTGNLGVLGQFLRKEIGVSPKRRQSPKKQLQEFVKK